MRGGCDCSENIVTVVQSKRKMRAGMQELKGGREKVAKRNRGVEIVGEGKLGREL